MKSTLRVDFRDDNKHKINNNKSDELPDFTSNTRYKGLFNDPNKLDSFIYKPSTHLLIEYGD